MNSGSERKIAELQSGNLVFKKVLSLNNFFPRSYYSYLVFASLNTLLISSISNLMWVKWFKSPSGIKTVPNYLFYAALSQIMSEI